MKMHAYAGKGKLAIHSLELSTLVEETRQLLLSAISKKAETRGELKPGVFVDGDPDWMRPLLLCKRGIARARLLKSLMPKKITRSKATPLDISPHTIERRIYLIRGQKVMLDEDLADLYRVENRSLVQAMKRNAERFPSDFMFQLSKGEWHSLRSQIVISKGRGGRRYPPYAFTEQGVAMLATVLKSKRAVLVNVEIIRTFVRLRRVLATHEDLARKFDALEGKYDAQFKVVFDAIRELMKPPPEDSRRSIGFKRHKE